MASNELVLLPPSLKTALIAELKKIPLLSPLQILDVAEVPRTSGGSGGLRRYWLFVDGTRDGQDILELKELSRPGTSFGNWVYPQTADDKRVETSKNFIWKESPDFYHAITLQNVSYLVRSRTRDSLDVKTFLFKDVKSLLLVQVGAIAAYHRTFDKADFPLKPGLKKIIPFCAIAI